ncbi:hypothetical protein KO506_12305 [Polaribacter vadi]|uniref:hypothetical protein n=1 Tax=Polaribacter TaxID=52959 RepID=UPI001C0A4B43|nr:MULTISPECIES: hypothetical protein [Polaribacter]MBU3012190.1 hypothetical protein [Polaribacter vadi]MDO6742006.1 hypothetical protein [Polaribacter sp. 1_MG-2023]
MGYKKVCLDCRKAFNRPINMEKVHISICPQCKKPMTELYHLFQPPKQTDIKKWEVVNFLVENGFKYYHIWEQVFKNEKGEICGTANYAKYPQSMKDAKEFVELYKEQAITE